MVTLITRGPNGVRVNQRELALLGATALAGVVAAVLLFFVMGAAPSIGLTSIYVDMHVALLFCCLSCLAVVGTHARAAQPRLVAIFTVIGGLVAVGLLWSAVGWPFSVIPYAAVGIVSAAVVAVAFGAGVVPETRFYELTALLCCSLFVFGLIYFSVLTLRTKNFRYLVPLVVVTPLFLAVTVTLRNQLSPAT